MPGEYRAVWSTAGGGIGYTVFHFATTVDSNAEAQTIANAVRAFFQSLVGLFPNEVSINFESEYLNLAADGTLEAVFAVAPPAQVLGTDTSTYNRAAGVRVDWGTGQIVNGRRLTGRTYLVPVGAGAYDATGLVTSANATAILAAANTLISATASTAPLAVWSRTHQVSHVVTTPSVPSKGAILTGRRD